MKEYKEHIEAGELTLEQAAILFATKGRIPFEIQVPVKHEKTSNKQFPGAIPKVVQTVNGRKLLYKGLEQVEERVQINTEKEALDALSKYGINTAPVAVQNRYKKAIERLG